ncbi:hypothetical protein Bca52824_018786 [Brassica carinata]|uniref:Uncharacterized protein n=1 Tax=Brassica carinata TaxID=52824 RepID=A0A8X7VQN0_BRACI|nr:hypothetical protein Bca52824_018786 [Brassica carinata]
MKRPMEDVYGADAVEGYIKGKMETTEHYRALLRLAKEQRKSESEWNDASSKVNSIAAQMKLLDAIIKAKANLTSWLSWRHLPLSILKPKQSWVL